MRILLAASECTPFSKTGGLGDVASGLSQALVKKGHEVSVFLPFYLKTKRTVLDNYEFIDAFSIPQGNQMIGCNILKDVRNGVNFYFVECGTYFERDGFYGYGDDEKRYSYFCQAVRKAIIRLDLRPEIIHVNDWQTAILPLLCADAGLKFKSVLTIHNPLFQGYFNSFNLGNYLNIQEYYYSNGLLKFNDQVSLLKGGICTCDAITTVSITHARELLSDFHAFNGLGYVLNNRQSDMFGIVNGIDYDFFTPESDKFIEANYDIRTYKDGKYINKEAVLKAFGFDTKDIDKPLFAAISRLTSQKGVHRILRNLENIASRNARLIILGQGDYDIEKQLKDMQAKYPDNIRIYLGYNEELSHLIYAGSDFFLMPSMFEPCGLGQIIAMHYGSLPIVSKVGGLNDTVNSYFDDKKTATGFSFASWDENCFDYSINLAIDMYYNKNKDLDTMIKNAMKADFSWSKQANEYIELYQYLLTR